MLERLRRTCLGLLALFAIFAGDAALRLHLAFAHPAYDPARPESVLRSDPAWIAALVEDVLQAGGIPEHWGADRSLEHPEALNVMEVAAVGLEFVALLVDRWVRPGLELHDLGLWTGSLLGAAASLAVALLARSVSRSWWAAGLAALLFLGSVATHRTIGFGFMREDLALPLLVLHLAALARALTHDRMGWWGATGLLGGLALATWHGTGVLLLAEVVGLALALLTSERTRPRALASAGVLLAVCLLVPALRAKGGPLALGPWSAILLACAAAAPRSRLRLLALALAPLPLLLGAGGDMAHVRELLHLRLASWMGQDPLLQDVSAQARMMDQGPFLAPGPDELWRQLGILLPLGLAAVVRAARRRTPSRILAILWLTALPLSLLAVRNLAWSGMLSCAFLAVVALELWPRQPKPWLPLVAIGALGVNLVTGVSSLFTQPTSWHGREQVQRAGRLVDAVRDLVPRGEPIFTDFMTGPTLRAVLGHPVCLSPKWERKESRERVLEAWNVLYHGAPDELRAYILERSQCRYVVLSADVLLANPASLRLAGLVDPGLVEGTGLALWFSGRTQEGDRILWTDETPVGRSVLIKLGHPSD